MLNSDIQSEYEQHSVRGCEYNMTI